MMQELSQKIQEIEMPEEMKQRIIRNCYNKTEVKAMRKNKVFQKPVVAVASVMVCLCLVGVTAVFAANGKLEGFFKDITRWDGAVIGISYEQATEEIKMSAVAAEDELTVTAEFVKAEMIPYKEFETFGIKEYRIMDEQGNVVIKGDTTEAFEIMEGKVNIVIPIADFSSGKYTLVVSGFIGSKKADQPLTLGGNWECEITY